MGRPDRLLTLFDGEVADQRTPNVAADIEESDIRLKADVAEVGRLANGLGLYRFRYRDDETVHVGVMAQEVERVVPEAVIRGSDGYLRVDYPRLGLRMMTWQEWLEQDKPDGPAQ
jgi:hypothetical protein